MKVPPILLGYSDFVSLRERTELRSDFATLLGGGQVRKRIDENVTLRALNLQDIWSLLLFSGYLRIDADEIDDWGQHQAWLSLPNREVGLAWRRTFLDWLVARAGEIEPLHRALLSGDAEALQALLSQMLLLHTSSHDVKETQDEAFYHAFVLGLLVSLEPTHAVRSNRETSLGRADVLLTPKQTGQAGVVLLCGDHCKKKEKGRTLDKAAEAALQQIEDRRHADELVAMGAEPIRLLGVAFSGKEVAVRARTLDPRPVLRP